MSDREDVNKRVLSHSTLGWFKRSPAYFKYMVEHPDISEETPAMIFGNLFHTLVLEPNEVEYRFFVYNQGDRPDKAKNMNGKENKEWKLAEYEKAGDKKVITASDMSNAKFMADKINYVAKDFIENAKQVERKIEWRKDGVDLKGFIDIDHPDYMVDLKTAVDAYPKKWQRKAFWDYDYHRQAAMYLDGDAKGLYTGGKEFYFIVIEKVPPYLVSFHLVSDIKLAQGMTQYKELITDLKKCRKSGKWPDYKPKINIWE